MVKLGEKFCAYIRTCFIVILIAMSTTQTLGYGTLRQMLDAESKINVFIESHVKGLETTISRVESRIDELLSGSSHTDRAYAGRPLAALVMLRRLLRGWAPLLSMVEAYSNSKHLQIGQVRWPSVNHYEGAARAVMRFQMIHNQNKVMLAKEIKITDYFEIARQYFLKERFAEAKEWLQHALATVQDRDDVPTRETLLHYLAVAACFSGDAMTSRNILRILFRENSLSKPPDSLTNYHSIMGTRGCAYPYNEAYRQLEENYRKTGSDMHVVLYYRNNTEVETHSRLCRGEASAKTVSRLVCRYVHYLQPHLRLQPFKLEELQLEPPVVRFYDLVSDSEAETLIGEANGNMKPAVVGLEGSVTEYRTSFVSWLYRDSRDWLDRRISDATQLDTEYAEHHQVSQYSILSEYLPHVDFFHELNDVEEGGNTVFTLWGLSVPPVKNSAVMWFNYKPNGEWDESSQHSGCPVFKGTKWVLNKWFHNDGNGINYPCTTDRQGSFQGFYL